MPSEQHRVVADTAGEAGAGSGRRVLVVAIVPPTENLLRDAVHAAEVRLVAPASDVSALQRLANDEDAARLEAERTAADAAGAVGSSPVRAEVGDVDPLQAAEDALRTFDADEIVVVVPPEGTRSAVERSSLEAGFERFGRPVRYLVARA
jgi:hypothetical protein